jgi:hypothetical protein
VDDVRWQEYETGLEDRLVDLHSQVHRETYRAKPSRRVYMPKADGRQRPLGVAALEDKIVQQVVVNSSSRSAKGNKYMRRVLNQAAHAAARSKGTDFQAVFRRLLPRLGYQSAVWAIAHRLCRLVWKILHEGIRYIEQGIESEPKLLMHRAKYIAKQLRKFGYNVQITPANSAPA